MSKYVCPNCNHDFKIKSHYETHMYKKKNPCLMTQQNPAKNDIKTAFPAEILQKEKIDIICTYCTKTYYDNYNLKRHQSTCKKKKESEKKLEEIEFLKNKILELEIKINNPQTINNNTNNTLTNSNNTTNNNTINNNTININIKEFGRFTDEDIKQIGNAIFWETMKKYGGFNPVYFFVDHVYADNDTLKEYKNVKITDQSRNKALVYKSEEWQKEHANKAVETMVSNGYQYYEKKFEELYEEIQNKPELLRKRCKRNRKEIYKLIGPTMFEENENGDRVDENDVVISKEEFKKAKEDEIELKYKIKDCIYNNTKKIIKKK